MENIFKWASCMLICGVVYSLISIWSVGDFALLSPHTHTHTRTQMTNSGQNDDSRLKDNL